MMADIERGLSVLGHTSAPTSSSARWYRFDIDCAANPAGVSVKALMREADGPRRKVKSSTSASATAVAANGTTGGPAAAATASSQTTMHHVAVADADANGTAAPEGGAEGPALSAPSSAKVGLASGAPPGSRAGVSGLPILTKAAVAKKNSLEGGGRNKDAVGDGAAASEVATAHDANSSDAEATIGSNADSVKAVAAAPADVSGSMSVESGPEPAGELQTKAGPQDQHRERASNWMSVIERLELEYGGGGAFVTDGASSGSRSDESDGDDAEDKESGGDGNGNEGLEGEGNGNDSGNGGEGNAGGKKKAKSKKKPARKHSFDYEDDFIDDTELEKQYYAKEASSKVQTVHSGFFANQGTVATVKPDGGKESGGAGADGSGVGDGDVVIRKKKKPKASSSNEGGEGTKTSSGSSKKRKTSAESAAGPKKTPKVSDQQAVLADHFTGSEKSITSAQQRLGESGSTTPSVDGVISTASGATASSAAAVTFSGDANGSDAFASVAQEGDGASSGSGGVTSPKNSDARNKDSSVTDAAGAGVAASSANGFESGGTGGGGKGGSGEKNGKNGTKPSGSSWDSNLETAMKKFEEDSKAWVKGGRAEGEESDRVLEDMGTLDVFARRTLADVHNSRTYLMRLAAVYGNPPLEMKTMLIELKEREDREECTRLQQEFDALRSVFVSEVAGCVGQLAATGQPLTPPFSWSDNLRGHLHDMLKAFEAWSLKEHGGPRTRQALAETKSLYDQLAQEWPAELSMTADCLRKMFNNEKRRIKAKANKEAAAEAGPAVATDTSAPPLPPSSAAATAVTPSSQNTPPANQSATSTSVAPAASNGGTGGFVDGPARQQQAGLTMPPSALQQQRSSKETPTSSNLTGTPPGTPFPAPSPGQQQVLPLAGGGGEGDTLSFAEVSAATLTPEYFPPLGSRFDLPPSFDPRNFRDEMDDGDETVPVTLQ